MQDSLRNYYLQQLGIESWVFYSRRDSKPLNQEIESELLESSSLTHRLRCKECSLEELTPGQSQIRLLWVGERLTPDVSHFNPTTRTKAVKLLNQMARSFGFSEKEVTMTYFVKCNSKACSLKERDELTPCHTSLRHQIAEIKPQLIIVLGPIIGQFILNRSLSLDEMRNAVFDYFNIPALVTFDLLHLLTHPQDKKQTYHDLKRAHQILNIN